MRKLLIALAGVGYTLMAAGATPTGQSIDAKQSSIVARFSQMSVPVTAPFRRFTGTIDFNPAHPDQAQARIEIDMGSFDIGDQDYNAEIRKPEWFDSHQYPAASFEAQGLKPQGESKYLTTGTLSLKGKQQQLTIPVTVKQQAGARSFDGDVSVSRTYFNIGGPDWKGTVADQVLIHFHMIVPAAP